MSKKKNVGENALCDPVLSINHVRFYVNFFIFPPIHKACEKFYPSNGVKAIQVSVVKGFFCGLHETLNQKQATSAHVKIVE